MLQSREESENHHILSDSTNAWEQSGSSSISEMEIKVYVGSAVQRLVEA